MPRLSFKIDEATLLKAYNIGSLNPSRWEDINHDFDDTVAGSLVSPSVVAEREGDPLGLGHIPNLKDMDMESKAAILISSKTFDPATYLSVVHPNATYHDLAAGIAFLQSSLEARAESLRELVEESFDQFVSVKAATDGLYEEMRQGLITPESDYASKPLRDHLKQGVQKSNQIFLPVLENASKAQKLRTTLGVFDRSKFFFNLPSFIIESIDAGRYEFALRDYKKGKYLLENRPSQLLPIGNTKEGSASKAAQEQQKRVLNKVWNSVEKAMGEMRKVLISQLQDPKRSVEEQEKTLETLLELQASEEPIWSYFDSHHGHIMNKMNAAHRTSERVLDDIVHEHPSTRASDSTLWMELETAIHHLANKDSDVIIAKGNGELEWNSLLEMIKNISDAMISSLPNFWKISKNFIDGKYKKNFTSSGTRRSPTQCRTMAFEIVKLYISLISQIFVLSDVAVMSSANNVNSATPSCIPTNSHSLCTAHYLQKILHEVQDCVNDVTAMDISNDIANGLKSLIESLRWRFVDILTKAWLRDAKTFYHLENWAIDPSEPAVTQYLSQFEHFQRHATTVAYKLSANSESSRKGPMPQAFVAKINRAFFDALYGFLDGLVLLATEEVPSSASRKQEMTLEPAMRELDLKDTNVRLLLVISNLNHFSRAVLPGMLSQFENAFGQPLTEERKTMNSVIDELDSALFDGYIRPHNVFIADHLREACLQHPWARASEPTGIRPWVYEVMNYLVTIHSQICNAAETLLERALVIILDDLAAEATRQFQQIKRYNTGGLLQAVLELTFIHKSLGHYGRESKAGQSLEDLYTKQITQVYAPSSKDPDFKVSFEAMQKLLSDARRATAVQFLCFRQSKEVRTKPSAPKLNSEKESNRTRNRP